MKRSANGIIYSPSDLITYMNDEFSSWMDRFYLEHPNGGVVPDADDDSVRIAQVHGDRHELAFLELLRRGGADVFDVDFNRADAVEQTAQALQNGHAVIYQGVLRLLPFEGRSDFLFRADGESQLGGFHYEVWDTKLARKPKPYFIIQLCCYAEMLAEAQGRLPHTIGIILGDGQKKSFSTASYFHFYQKLKQDFLNSQSSFDGVSSPEPFASALSRWQMVADQKVRATDHLIQIAGIRKSQIRKLQMAGIETLTALVENESEEIPSMSPVTLANLKRQARLQLASRGVEPHYEVIQSRPGDRRRGLALIPPGSELDVWFDMEGYPYHTEGLEYLFGAVVREGEQLSFHDWWGHDRAGEKLAFEGFIDWVVDRFRRDPKMHIYHYGAYEVSAVRRLSTRHGTREDEVDDLLRAEVFVDLYRAIAQGLAVGVESYSIKYIEKIYMPGRKQEVAKADDSIVYYERWLEYQDGAGWQTSKTLNEIREYNRIDCESTCLLNDWLRKVAQMHHVEYAPPVPQVKARPPRVRPQEALAQRLLAQVPVDASLDSPWRLQIMLAHLLNFYRRETKPTFWSLFDWRDMSDKELFDDPDCLARLTRTTRAPEKVSRSLGYEYAFDPDQETSFEEGDVFMARHDFDCHGRVEQLDRDAGRILLVIGSKRPQPPDELAILPKEFTDYSVLEESILTTVSKWAQGQAPLPQALEDVLRKTPPRLKAPVPAFGTAQDRAVSLIQELDDSYLCVQGPPGSGKTTLAAGAIAELVSRGQRVGVTANSHKAASNILDKAALACQKRGLVFEAAKLGNETSHQPYRFVSSAVQLRKETTKFWQELRQLGGSPFQLLGGTTWAFSAPDAAGMLDYLFVDEAGQLSLAHLTAMAPSARNLVLIGDQMQLEQPIQGSHPGECGQSCLEYLLSGHATIPEALGVFLDQTRRMHPQLTAVVSESVYDSKLQAHPSTTVNVLNLGSGGLVRKNCGVLFVPVVHEGNVQSSQEEADVIFLTVAELLLASFVDENNVSRHLTPQDILVVAPYNKQVRTIARTLQSAWPDLEVGTVDRFQGKQAAVVIVSMSSSDVEGAPRGMEFLFSKNRLNVAISRARCLAIVVGSPELLKARCTTINQMEMLNFFCRIVDEGMK